MTLLQSRKSLIYFFKMPFRSSAIEMTDVLVRILISSAGRSVRRVNDLSPDLDRGQSSNVQYLKSDDVHMSCKRFYVNADSPADVN